MSCCGESALKHINWGSIFLNDYQVSGHFDTKYTAVLLIEPILHKFEDLKITNFFNPEEVYFLTTFIGQKTGPEMTKLATLNDLDL